MVSRDQLIIDNLNLARWHASRKRHSNPALSYEDLYQAACIGLVKAADTWDSSQALFATWATFKIRAEIGEELRRMRRVRVPRGECPLRWEPMPEDIEENVREPSIDLIDETNHMLSWLSKGTRTMMKLHLGLDGCKAWTETRIASELRCSRAMVDNRISGAIQLLRTSKDRYA